MGWVIENDNLEVIVIEILSRLMYQSIFRDDWIQVTKRTLNENARRTMRMVMWMLM